MTKPVYIINGFLESGKTEFITFTLGQPYFQIKGRTLLILCEEGENEYDPALLKKSRTDVVLIEEEEEFNPNHLIELEKQYKPARIIIEYNGMWNFKNMKLPWYWKVEQQITTIDGSTFPMYYTNMKSLLAEMIRKSEMIIFNRCDGIQDLNVYKRNIKAAMTCCAEDMAFLGYACEYAGTKDLKQKEWVKVTAKVAKEYFADYKGEGPVLHAISVEKAKAPKDPVISFN